MSPLSALRTRTVGSLLSLGLFALGALASACGSAPNDVPTPETDAAPPALPDAGTQDASGNDTAHHDAGTAPDAADASPPDGGDCNVHPGPAPFSLDTSYATKIVTVKNSVTFFGAAVDSQGRFLVWAQPDLYEDAPLYLVRLTASGQLDATFGNVGIATVPLARDAAQQNQLVRAATIDARSRIILLSTNPTGGADIRRITESGVLDSSFGAAGTGGVVIGASDAGLGGSPVYADALTTYDNAIITSSGSRIREDGSGLDSAFTLPITVGVESMLVTRDSTFVGSGGSVYDLTDHGAVPTFANGGSVAFPRFTSHTSSLALGADGSVFATGFEQVRTGGRNTVIHLLKDGSYDPAFGTGGVVDFPQGAYPFLVASRCDGLLVVITGGSADGTLESNILDAHGLTSSTPFGAWAGRPLAFAFDTHTGATLLARRTLSAGQIEVARLNP